MSKPVAFCLGTMATPLLVLACRAITTAVLGRPRGAFL